MDYQPACFQCRVDAGNDVAGVKDTSLCVPHLKLRCADLTRPLKEFKELAFIRMKDNHDLASQLAEAKAAHQIALTEFYDMATEHAPLVVKHEQALRDLAEARERERVLVEIIQSTISEEGHGKYCDAIKGPEPETRLVEEDCNCWVKYARAALAAKEE